MWMVFPAVTQTGERNAGEMECSLLKVFSYRDCRCRWCVVRTSEEVAGGKGKRSLRIEDVKCARRAFYGATRPRKNRNSRTALSRTTIDKML